MTGMHASVVYKLRRALGLDSPGTPVKVTEPLQMLGEIKMDLIESLGADVVPLGLPQTFFGYRSEGWKPWTLFDGTPVLVPAGFSTEPDPSGAILMYPQGDRSVPPSGRMPKDGFYFDPIVRQSPIDEKNLSVADNLEEFRLICDEDLAYLQQEVARLYSETDKAILGAFGGAGFGDIALVPAPWMKHTRGIRDFEEWYISYASRPQYIYQVFQGQCEVALENLKRIYAVVGNRITAALITGTDFGQQAGPLISPKTYRQLFQPFHKRINDWVHKNTTWKTLMHSCGSVRTLIEDFIASGFDILNPVQCSATGMDPTELKKHYGDRLTFWGGGVDTQRTLPFGTPDDVRREVRDRIRIFGSGGGFVFNTIHNVQAQTPVENLLAMYQTWKEHGTYPLE
jgi:hypothetical protein